MMASQHIEFESGPFLHSLFGHDPALLRNAELAFGVRLTARDGLLQIAGDPARVAEARSFFEELEDARRRSGEIDPAGFTLALDAFRLRQSRGASVTETLHPSLLGPVHGARLTIKARNLRQADYLKAMDAHPVCFGLGPAGTGKTWLAVAHAVHGLKTGRFRRIILTRPAVEAGEALGFLPGDMKEKILPYLRPLYDAIHEMLGPDELERMLDRSQVEIAPLAYMRGRTLNHSVIILDEAQNTTREQMLMFLTRIGEESSCIITGDPSQIDLRPASRSGLLEARRILQNIKGIAFTEFTTSEVVRHRVVQRIIEAYDHARTHGDFQHE